MNRAFVALVTFVSVVVGGWLALALGGEERGGVPHRPVLVDGRVPATLYVPGAVTAPGVLGMPDPPPPGSRPPVVVLAHGHSADQATMSVLARRVAAAGYAVVTFDFRGHGLSTERHQSAGFEGMRSDLDAVLTWLGTVPYVDAAKVVVVGHSMGAAGVLDFAVRDRRPVATVAMGGAMGGIEPTTRAKNVLFVVAEGDAGVVREGAERTARLWSGTPLSYGQVYGDQAQGTAVALREVAGTNHLTMLFSDTTAGYVVDWVAKATGRPAAASGAADRRPALTALYLVCAAVLLTLVGFAGGALARTNRPPAEAGRPALGLPLVVGALLLPLPWLAWGDAGHLLGMEAGGALALLLGIAGTILLAVGRLTPARCWFPAQEAWSARHTLAPAALVLVGVIVLLTPLGAMVHGLVPTPERVLIWALTAALILPFFLAVDRMLRRGRPPAAAARSLAARLLVLAIVMIGVITQVLPGMLGLYVMVLGPFLLLLELAAYGLYALGRDHRLTAFVQAGAVAWVLSWLSPIMW
ncbi:hypothetical protein GCM10010404_88760 [Nonomuraea africana]|uniref:Dienelactone hydrolase n=1 Tax=Nonomuraea africana TaxID=46171 RepID=A0ABR9KEN4_9ACTN|nr:alpha/beta fold hydrolase [Nonomuraea africana]MBE1560493.1 dienelactone hydrolase [Nonomuraea africana]